MRQQIRPSSLQRNFIHHEPYTPRPQIFNRPTQYPYPTPLHIPQSPQILKSPMYLPPKPRLFPTQGTTSSQSITPSQMHQYPYVPRPPRAWAPRVNQAELTYPFEYSNPYYAYDEPNIHQEYNNNVSSCSSSSSPSSTIKNPRDDKCRTTNESIVTSVNQIKTMPPKDDIETTLSNHFPGEELMDSVELAYTTEGTFTYADEEMAYHYPEFYY